MVGKQPRCLQHDMNGHGNMNVVMHTLDLSRLRQHISAYLADSYTYCLLLFFMKNTRPHLAMSVSVPRGTDGACYARAALYPSKQAQPSTTLPMFRPSVCRV